MSLQVMIPIEALDALIAFKGSVCWWGMLLLRLVLLHAVHLLHASCVTAVIARHHVALHTINKSHLTTWTVQVRHDWAIHCR